MCRWNRFEFHLNLLSAASCIVDTIACEKVSIRKYRLRRKSLNSCRSSSCVIDADQLMPIELVIPLKSLVTHIAHRIDVDPSIHPVQTFNGPEKSFSRLRNDYYHSQVAAGDPIRARRTKRIARD